jgi:trans-aconitate methyltransferase
MTEWDAAKYVQQSGLQRAMAEEVLRLVQLNGSESVLDIGCGDGRTTAELAARLSHGTITGLDSSCNMIELASSRFGPAVHPNLHFLAADARRLPLKPAFDLVISFNALHWIPEQNEALRSIRSVLKSDGKAQIRLVPDGRRKSLETVIEETRRSSAWADYFRNSRDPYLHLTPEQYAALAEQNGFRVLRIHTEAKSWDFQSREAFFAFCSVTLAAWTRFLPQTDKADFITDVLDRYQTVAADKPGEENTFKFYQMDVTLTPERFNS